MSLLRRSRIQEQTKLSFSFRVTKKQVDIASWDTHVICCRC